MCPLRFILVFLSAALAGYFAWRTVAPSSPHTDADIDDINSDTRSPFRYKQMIRDGFWVFVDMASGRYLWRNLREMKMKNLNNSKELLS
ncbi:hypothetical protein RJ641_026545 [Dillenia turbinata]|uniref:Uncharacterized protein n=1 Tax=Dillenia turbinata TaxID=194707 RepID=A0AAN8W322_9MAGN